MKLNHTMALSSHDFKRIIDSPANAVALTFADNDNDRMAFHAKRATSFADVSAYFSLFKKKIDGILIPSKRKPFWDLFEYPLPTNEIISDASDELNKVFDAKDRVIELNCADNETRQDFASFENDRINQFIRNDVFNAILQRCNSVILVDLPREQMGELPEPYPLILEAKEIFDIGYGIDNKVQYLCIKKADNLYYFVDEQAYYLVEYNGYVVNANTAVHGLGFCPVFAIWHDNMDREGIRKLSPLIDILALLDDYVFKYIQKKFLDLYADSPILEKYEEACANPDCVDGYVISGERKAPCEDCKGRAFIGAGSILSKPVPRGMETNIESAAKWIAVPVDSLNYTKEKLEGSFKRIYEFLTGYVKGGEKMEAVNQEQVYSQIESRKAKLAWWAENLENVHKLLIDTIGKLRHGKRYVDSTVSYGRDFHLWTLNTALKELETAQRVGLPLYLLSQMRENVSDLIIGNSAYKAKRIAILKLLEPYPDVSLSLIPKDAIEFEIKANFSGYINQFETKYGDIVSFASLVDLPVKVDKIREVITGLAMEVLKRRIEGSKKFSGGGEESQGVGSRNDQP